MRLSGPFQVSLLFFNEKVLSVKNAKQITFTLLEAFPSVKNVAFVV